ncbi:MAG: flagellar filament outer layer protein FlaA [Spirochaetota bacterium]
MTRFSFITVSLAVMVLFPVVLPAQEMEVSELQVGVETAGHLLADIPVSHLEDAGTWDVVMPIDEGLVVSMSRKGRPLEMPEIDPKDGTTNQYVLGVKVSFNQRGYNRFTVSPPRPIKIPGITKAITMWVCGRSFKHRLYLHVLDFMGSEKVLDAGLLDFMGWKKMSVVIPPTIAQENFHSTNWYGLSFLGFSVRTAPEESYGNYYVYFDEIRAITDVFREEHRVVDDMHDGW